MASPNVKIVYKHLFVSLINASLVLELEKLTLYLDEENSMSHCKEVNMER